MTFSIPETVTKYAETPVFTQATVPAKLTAEHRTKVGVWGRLCVISGTLNYIIPGPPAKKLTLNPGDFAVIRPEELHWVDIQNDVSFKVEFLK